MRLWSKTFFLLNCSFVLLLLFLPMHFSQKAKTKPTSADPSKYTNGLPSSNQSNITNKTATATPASQVISNQNINTNENMTNTTSSYNTTTNNVTEPTTISITTTSTKPSVPKTQESTTTAITTMDKTTKETTIFTTTSIKTSTIPEQTNYLKYIIIGIIVLVLALCCCCCYCCRDELKHLPPISR
uniref:Sialomucin core protein 24 n=1 Tax=Meloidogyne hapla TaxID=6305 RepID=A0A1I8BHH5_MELHA